LGWKLTWAVVELGVDAVTLRPPALMPAIAPNVRPEAPVAVLSVHVWDRVATDPDAVAAGDRPLHSCT